MPTPYQLTQQLKNRLKAKGFEMVCAYKECKQPLKPGDKIISRRVGRSGTVRYHEDCFWKLWM